MIKFHKIILIGLINCFPLKIYSAIGQKMMDSIMKGNITIVESEIKANKITKEEAKDLLEIAKQVEEKKKARIGKAPRNTKVLIWALKQLRLISVQELLWVQEYLPDYLLMLHLVMLKVIRNSHEYSLQF